MERPTPKDNEIFFDGGIMITETDLDGIITYANRKFLSITGYTHEELINKSHNIVRHPDMPHSTFHDMWKNLKKEFPWEGYVKNLTKDGSFYWVHVSIIPRYDEFNNLTGYIASRAIPNKKVLKDVKRTYALLLKKEEIFPQYNLRAA